eukprot:m.125528 g.125528  ORF g.125528 m.125528 type:complete len:57 (-) comp17328_c0_seq4:1379-1549(-)
MQSKHRRRGVPPLTIMRSARFALQLAHAHPGTQSLELDPPTYGEHDRLQGAGLNHL